MYVHIYWTYVCFPYQLYPFGSLQGDEAIRVTGFGGRSSPIILNETFFFYDLVTTIFYVSNKVHMQNLLAR